MAASGTGPLQHGARANDSQEDAKRPNRERECFTRPLHASAGPRNRDLNANDKTIKRMFVGRGVQIFARV